MIDNINEDSYLLFSNSMEGKVFFKRHLPDKAVLTKVLAREGAYYFITGSKKEGFLTIFAMKGPVK